MTASLIHRHRQRPPCPCGECSTAHGFCPDHAARLAKLREGYQTDWKAKISSTANGGKKKVGRPACCMPGCWEPRSQGRHYCWEHEGEEVPE